MGTCKVCRVLAKYGNEGYDERLLSQWTAPRPERKGYRQLARWLNVDLLRQRMDGVGMNTLGGEVESKYDRLRAEDTTAAELERQLAAAGIDVEELTDDFVSYGVVRRHILECLDASREETSTEWEPRAIDIATDRAETKVGEAVRSLLNKGDLEGGDEVTVHVETELECERCHTRVPLARALRRGSVCTCVGDEVAGR
jgi:hypothetical protein